MVDLENTFLQEEKSDKTNRQTEAETERAVVEKEPVLWKNRKWTKLERDSVCKVCVCVRKGILKKNGMEERKGWGKWLGMKDDSKGKV